MYTLIHYSCCNLVYKIGDIDWTVSVIREARSVPSEGEGMTGDSCGSSPRGSEVAEEVAMERTVSLKRRCSRSAMSRKGVSSWSSAIGDGQQEVRLRSSAMGDVWQEAWLEAWQERDGDIDRESQQGNLRWRRVCPRLTWRQSVSFSSFSLPMALSALRSMSSAMSRAQMISLSAE